jgi:hypothetical protein
MPMNRSATLPSTSLASLGALAAFAVLGARTALADGRAPEGRSEVSTRGDSEAAPLDLRLSLSSFLYRELGDDAPALVDQGAELQNATPVRRFFGDLRLELAVDRVNVDARVRQVGVQRAQSGADGGSEYELRTLSARLGSAKNALVIGRQFIDAVGATKIDGISATHAFGETLGATAFAGAFPAIGSRSLGTDYLSLRNADGSTGSRLVPLCGGLGLSVQSLAYHGDVGVGGVYLAQEIPDATSSESSRVFTTSSGYWRPGNRFDAYHFALLELASGQPATLTNGSLGADFYATSTLKLSGTVHHVSTDQLRITTRDLLADPDPSAMGVVQNNLTSIRVSQDLARVGASLALAEQRFELSLSGGVHRRPGVEVALADGSTSVMFPASKSADSTVTLLDRRSIAGLRLALSASLTIPMGTDAPNRTRGTSVRFSASRPFSQDRGQLELDASLSRLRGTADAQSCMNSMNALSCYSAARQSAAQLGVLGTWRVSREWLLLADLHLGYRDVDSISVDGTLTWPRVYSITSFVRLQWRYR